jgi:hypothetical protein
MVETLLGRMIHIHTALNCKTKLNPKPSATNKRTQVNMKLFITENEETLGIITKQEEGLVTFLE